MLRRLAIEQRRYSNLHGIMDTSVASVRSNVPDIYICMYIDIHTRILSRLFRGLRTGQCSQVARDR